MKRLIGGVLSGALVFALAGCAPDPQMPYLGRWIGTMDIVSETGTPAGTNPRNQMEVHLQLYATQNRVVMLMNSKAQSVEARGKWELGKKNGVVVTLTSFQNDDRGGEEFRSPSEPFLDDPALEKGLKAPVIFRTEGPGTLRSLPFTLGGAVRQITVRKDTIN